MITSWHVGDHFLACGWSLPGTWMITSWHVGDHFLACGWSLPGMWVITSGSAAWPWISLLYKNNVLVDLLVFSDERRLYSVCCFRETNSQWKILVILKRHTRDVVLKYDGHLRVFCPFRLESLTFVSGSYWNSTFSSPVTNFSSSVWLLLVHSIAESFGQTNTRSGPDLS